ncbi:MAG: NTP transferase domain-containing protein [Candidatus Liptonbacteria bacterium]|nr:NTP transferase domain-containing protein [Candidatus Liptonbacteria bacterium]
MKKITKLVLPVAGIGKRLRPLTWRTPKALVPLNGDPLLGYVLREAKESGIEEVILVVSPNHEKYFKKYLSINSLKLEGLKIHFRFQEKPLGTGHAVLQAADLVKKDPFVVRYCDDLLSHDPPPLVSLIKLFHDYQAPILLLERVPRKFVPRYGVVGIKRSERRRFYQISEIVEKPKISEAPSNLTIVGGYALTPAILRNLKNLERGLASLNEDVLGITEAFQKELEAHGLIYGWEFGGRRLDCGTIKGFRNAEEILRQN